MLVRVLLAAILAGALAGVFATAVQSYRVVPLLVAAERFEESASNDAHAHDHDDGSAIEAHSHGAPGDGVERTALRLLSNIVAGVAFALLLTAAILLAGHTVSLRAGLVWGACGFVAFVLAPNFGLAPKLPGMAAADLATRQIWWLATVATTAAGLWLFAFKRGIVWMATGVVLVLCMHVYGAPAAPEGDSAVPASMAADFAVATLVASALFWLALGGLLGWLLDRALKSELADRLPV